MFVSAHRVTPLVLVPLALFGAVAGPRQARGDEPGQPVNRLTRKVIPAS